jgi:proline iminopeptidase
MFRKILIIVALVLGSLFLLTSAATAVLYFTHTGDYNILATTAEDATLPAIELDGYRFHSETFGDPTNPVIVVLHGGPGGDYRSILSLSALEDQYFVVFYDQRGSGLSPRVGSDELTLDRFIADLDLIVEQFSPGRQVIIIGHSWGAMLASAYIGRHPDKVSHAVLAEPGFLDNEHMETYYEKTGLRNLKPSLKLLAILAGAWSESLHIKGPDSQARQDHLINSFFSNPMDNHPLAGYYRDGKLENAAGDYWRFGALASRTIPASGLDSDGRLIDLAAGVENWDGNALFLSGSENSIIGPDYQRTQMDRFPRSEIVVIEGAGHTMFGEKPAESNSAVRTYLRQ